ncbi:MAG TPA: DJ-1/PfpI family protein [Planctomycetota bacterium]|nr:DJ-1/PfpI family protein [Planctomycetota bacterium]
MHALPPFRVGILAFPGAEELDVLGPFDVFARARADLDLPVEVLLLREGPPHDPVTFAHGLKVETHAQAEGAPHLDLLVAPGGPGTRRGSHVAALVEFLRRRGSETRIASICTGALLLADAGLLKNKTATTHREFLDELRRREPTADVIETRYVLDPMVSTSAGVTAGIDLSLALVRERFGAPAAQRIAERIEWKSA